MSTTAESNAAQPVIHLGTRLAIVRHGEAYCNVESFIGGHQGCRGLTDRGIRQAELLRERLVETSEFAKCSVVATSILPRAIETTEILLPALNVADFTASCDFCERHPGIADGLSWEEYEKQYKRTSLPGDDPYRRLSEGGESWVEFLDRAHASLLNLAARHPGELIVVVAHGGVIDASMIRMLDLPDNGVGVRLHPDHCSITEWEFTGRRWRLARYNDAAHLGAIESELRTPTPDWVHQDRALPGPTEDDKAV